MKKYLNLSLIYAIAAIGHVLTGAGLVLLLIALRKVAENRRYFYGPIYRRD